LYTYSSAGKRLSPKVTHSCSFSGSVCQF
jgi:hypothetical protein